MLLKPVSRQVMSPKGKPTTIIMIKEHSHEMTSIDQLL